MARALLAPADRRGPGHESGAVPAHAAPGRREGVVHRGRRRRPGDLRLAGRVGREPRAARAGLSGADRHQARAELPVDDADPALGKRADRAQPAPARQEALERARPRRRDPGDARRRRRGRSGRRRAPAARAPLPAPRPLRGLCGPLSRQSSGQGLRASAPRSRTLRTKCPAASRTSSARRSRI